MPARQTRDERIAELGFLLDEARKRAAAAMSEVDDFHEELKQLLPPGQKADVNYNGYVVHATGGQGHGTNFDEPGFRRALNEKAEGTKLWNKVSLRKLDQNLLAAAVKNGDIDPDLVDKFTTKIPFSPYVKVKVDIAS